VAETAPARRLGTIVHPCPLTGPVYGEAMKAIDGGRRRNGTLDPEQEAAIEALPGRPR